MIPCFWNGFSFLLLEIGKFPLKTLVLPIGKNFARKAFKHFAYVLMSSLLV
jgi:hypothetical protein